MPNRAASLPEVRGVTGVQSGKDLPDLMIEFGGAQNIPVSLRRGGKTIGHLDPLRRQFPNHLTQGCVLAAHERHVIDPDLLRTSEYNSLCGVGRHAFSLRPEFLQLLRH